MKKVLIAALCLLCAGSLAAQKKAVDQAGKMAGKPEKIEEARTLLRGAMQDPETANDPRTYYVAGLVEWKGFDAIKAIRALQNEQDITPDMGAMLLQGLDFFNRALELDATPDAKGKANRFAKDIYSQLAGHDWDLYSVGATYYNRGRESNANYPLAYESLMAAADIPAMPETAGATTLLPDSTRAFTYYLAGISAYSSKLPDGSTMVPQALEAFKKAAAAGSTEPNVYLFQIACLDNMMDTDSTKVASLYPQKLATAREAYQRFGLAQPNFLGYIIDDYVNNQNNAQGALDFLNGEIAAHPNIARLYTMRGYVNGRMGNDDGYLNDNLQAAQMPDADAEVLFDAARASFRYGQAKIGALGVSADDMTKRKELITKYVIPAKEMAQRALQMDPNGQFAGKLNSLISDIDYLMQ